MERQRCGPPGGVPFELEVILLVGLVVLFAEPPPPGREIRPPNPEDDSLYRVIKAVLVVVVVGTTYLAYRVGTDVVNTVQPREIPIRLAPGVRIHEVHNLPRPNTTAIEAVARSLSGFLRGGRH